MSADIPLSLSMSNLERYLTPVPIDRRTFQYALLNFVNVKKFR